MSPDIKIQRVTLTSPTDALKWSEDGQLAVISGQTATIFSPNTKSDDSKFYETTSTESIEHEAAFLAELPRTNDLELSVGGMSTDYLITDLDWSPSGLSAIKGCYLVALTSTHEAFIFMPNGNPCLNKWQLYTSFNRRLFHDLDIEAPISQQTVVDLRIHSLAWSAKALGPAFEPIWGASFAALGLESGSIVIYQVDDRSGITFVKRLKFGFTDWIVNIAWSKWYYSESVASSYIAVGTSSNELHIIPVILDLHTGEFTTGKQPFKAINASRKRISMVKWFSIAHSSYFVLTAAMSGSLHVSSIKVAPANQEHLDIQTQTLPTNISMDICGISHHQTPAKIGGGSKHDTLSIDVVSCHADVASFDIVPATNSYEHSSDSSLARFIKRVISKSEVETDIKVTMQCYAAISHPHSTYMALLYTVYAKNHLRYPINSQSSYKISFVPCIDYDFIDGDDNFPLPQLYTVGDGSSESNWWELAILEKLCPREKRQAFKDRLASNLELNQPAQAQGLISIHDQVGDLSSMSLAEALQKTIYCSPAVDSLRLLLHLKKYDTTDQILQLLAETVNLWVIQTGYTDFTQSSIDCAILQSFSDAGTIKAPDNIQALANNVEIPGSNFKETFDFTVAKSPLSLRSQSNHVWKRCSITLLPLTLTDTKSCTGCSRKAITKRSLESHGVQPGFILSTLLDTLQCCIFCGGRWFQRQQAMK